MVQYFEFKCNGCKRIYDFTNKDKIFFCCEEPVRRTYSIGGISFRGQGFYKNDSKRGK